MALFFEVLWWSLLITAPLMALAYYLRRRSRRDEQLQELYDEWMQDIAKDERFTLESLLQHIHHHTDEGRQEGISSEWFASMENLLEIIRLKQRQFEPTLRHKLERLYLHWQQDPQNNTPPPVAKSFRRLMRMLPDPPDQRPSLRERVEDRVQEVVHNMNDSRWHGS